MRLGLWGNDSGAIVGYQWEVRMADMLIRDVPDDVIAAVDAHAGRLGLSRSEYVRRRLAQDAATPGAPVSVDDLARFADDVEDLADPDVISRAWQCPPGSSISPHSSAWPPAPDAAEWATRIERGLVRITHRHPAGDRLLSPVRPGPAGRSRS